MPSHKKKATVDNHGSSLASPSSICSSSSSSSCSSRFSSSSSNSQKNENSHLNASLSADTGNPYIEQKEDEELQSKKGFVIPQSHVRRLIIKELIKNKKLHSNNLDLMPNETSYKITPKAVKLVQLHTEAFVSEIFGLSKDVLKLTRTKTLKADTIKLCIRWKIQSMLRSMQNQQC